MLGINDKDYSITFGLYFSVEWTEPRLNLSNELWGKDMVVKEDDLVPGEISQDYLEVIKSSFICSKSWVDQKLVDSQYFYLQPENIQNYWCSVQACWVVDRLQEEGVLQPGHQHHLHLPNVVWFLPLGHPEVQIPGFSLNSWQKIVRILAGRKLLLWHESYGLWCVDLRLHPADAIHHLGLWDCHQEPQETGQGIWGWCSW